MTEIEAARRLLPVWVALGLWLVPVYLAFSGYVLTGLFVARALRALPDSPWTERARCGFLLRATVQRSRTLHLAAAILIAALTLPAWAAPLPALRLLVTLIGALGGALLAGIGIDARLHGERRGAVFRSWLARSFLMFGPAYTTLLFGVLTTTSTGWSRTALALAGVVAALVQGLGYTSSVVQLLGLARPARERVASAVDRAAKRLGIRVRRVMEFDSI